MGLQYGRCCSNGNQAWAGKSDLSSNPGALTYQINILFNFFGTGSSSAKWGK